jgi:hypothetical protein
MTNYYKGTDIGLNYNAELGEWEFTNQAKNFIDTDTFSSPDPEFPTAPPEDDEEETTPDCPDGYIYNETLKQCVPDPDYENTYRGDGQQQTGGGGTIENFIPSDTERERQIKSGDAKSYIDNLKKRGLITEQDGKLFLKTESFGQTLASGGFARFGLADEPKAKMNRIIQDLQRMGAINLQVTAGDIDPETNEPEIKLGSLLQVSDEAGTFPTYSFAEGDMTKGNIDPFAFQTFTPAGSTDKFKTFADYISALQQVKTSVADVGADVRRGDTEYTIKEKEKAEIDKAKAEAKKAEAEAVKAEMDAVQPGQDVTDDQGNTYTKKDDGKGFVFKAKDPKPVTTVSYQNPFGNMDRPVQVGPRAGVMAPKPPTGPAGGPNLTNR